VGNIERVPTDWLYRDGWFWAALALGPLASWLLFSLMGGTAITGLAWQQWQSLVWLVLFYPVMEEWLFRGVLQRRLFTMRYGCQSVLGVSAANGVTSIVFAAAHLISQPPEWAALVLFPSLLFGGFRDRYESILPGVILHCCYNLGYFSIFGLPA
jgi:hypothetical protein